MSRSKRSSLINYTSVTLEYRIYIIVVCIQEGSHPSDVTSDSLMGNMLTPRNKKSYFLLMLCISSITDIIVVIMRQSFSMCFPFGPIFPQVKKL
jgi:hypothetical protein